MYLQLIEEDCKVMKRGFSLFSVLVVVFFIATISGCGKRLSETELYNQAKSHEKNEEFKKAAQTYVKLAKRFPNGQYAAESLFRGAIIYSNNLTDYDQSVRLHEKLYKTYPKSEYAPQALFMIGFTYANDVKDCDKAKKYYQQFLTKFPNSELAASVQWELNNLGKDINELDFLSKPTSEQSAQ